MQRILSFSVLATFVTAAPAVWAQRGEFPGSITILAPRNYVAAARAMQLTARVFNSRGALVRSRSLQWQVSDPARAAVDNSGLFLGLSPGPVDVTVTDSAGGLSSVRTFYVYPGGVAIKAPRSSVQAGDALPLSAQIQDADGNELANVPVQWFTDLPAVAAISAAGVLTGVAEGRVTVTVALDMGASSARFTAFTSIQVLRRADYRLKTLISSENSGPATTLVPTRVSAAGNFVAGITSLSNGGQALVLTQNGQLQALAFTGATLNGKLVARFESVSVNNRGDVAAIADAQAEWCEQIFVLFNAASKWTPAILDDTTRCSYGYLSPTALDKQGGIAYRYGPSLYYRKPDGTIQTVLSAGDHPPGINSVNNISNWGATPFGKLLIEAQNASNNSTYLAWDGVNFTKLFAVGDQIGNKPSQWAQLPMEINPDEYITRIGGVDWSSISRLKSGAWSTIAINGQNNLGWVQNGFDGADGYIYFFADTNGKTALMRTNGSSTDVLAAYPNWRDVSFVTATEGGSVVAYGTLGGPVPKVMRFNGTSSSTVLGSGLPVAGTAAPAIAQASIPKGINPSGAIVKTYGDSLLRLASGGITTLLQPGDPLPNGNLASMGGLAANRLGDVAFTAQHGAKMALYTYRSGQVQVLADTDDPFGGNGQIWGFDNSNNSQVAINNLGHVAAWTYASSGTGVFLFTGNAATARNVVRQGSIVPGTNASFTYAGQLALDDNDRVAFIGNLSSGKSGVFLWENGNLREVLETGQTDPFGRAYQYFANLQAAGSKFYLRVSSAGLNEHLVIDGASVNLLAADGYVASFGTVVNTLFGPESAANTRGDFVFPAVTPSGAALFVKRADGTDAQVAISSARGPDDEWLLNIFGAGISEQGDVLFSALGWVNGHLRLALYQATPTVH